MSRKTYCFSNVGQPQQTKKRHKIYRKLYLRRANNAKPHNKHRDFIRGAVRQKSRYSALFFYLSTRPAKISHIGRYFIDTHIEMRQKNITIPACSNGAHLRSERAYIPPGPCARSPSIQWFSHCQQTQDIGAVGRKCGFWRTTKKSPMSMWKNSTISTTHTHRPSLYSVCVCMCVRVSVCCTSALCVQTTDYGRPVNVPLGKSFDGQTTISSVRGATFGSMHRRGPYTVCVCVCPICSMYFVCYPL